MIEKVIQISNVIVVSPTPEQLLALVEAQLVKHTGKYNGYYYKTGVKGPFRKKGQITYYQVELVGRYMGHTTFGVLPVIN